MLDLIAVLFAVARLAAAQDTRALVEDDPTDEPGLLAHATITTVCLPAVDSSNEPIFSVQTNTDLESCTYVVNADNPTEVISTIEAVATPSAGTTFFRSISEPLSTIMGTSTGTMSFPPITTSTTVPTGSATTTSGSSTTSEATTTMETTSGQADESTTASTPAASATDGAAERIAMHGEALGVVGLMALFVAL